MKAYVLKEPGGVTNLKLEEIEKPTPAEGEVLIKVKAISINPVDTKTRDGSAFYNMLAENPPIILGWDISGVVEAIGDGVKLFKAGDEVFGMVNFPGHGRAYAEYVVSPEAHLAHKPANVSHNEAAAATLAALTAWQALVHQADIQPGQRVLIHAAAGGVGHFAVQIAKYFKAEVIGTASAKNHKFLEGIGADVQIDYTKHKPEEVVKDVDIVLDSLGVENTLKSLQSLKDGGTIISILGGAKDAVKEEAKKRNIKAESYLVQSSGEDMEQIANLMREGHLKAHVSHAFAFNDMAKAHRQVETRRTVGKVVVSLDE